MRTAWVRAQLYRVYISTDVDCVNIVYRGSVVGSPAWAPRTTAGLVLPSNTTEMGVAAGGWIVSDGKNGKTFAIDDATVTENESMSIATSGGTGDTGGIRRSAGRRAGQGRGGSADASPGRPLGQRLAREPLLLDSRPRPLAREHHRSHAARVPGHRAPAGRLRRGPRLHLREGQRGRHRDGRRRPLCLRSEHRRQALHGQPRAARPSTAHRSSPGSRRSAPTSTSCSGARSATRGRRPARSRPPPRPRPSRSSPGAGTTASAGSRSRCPSPAARCPGRTRSRSASRSRRSRSSAAKRGDASRGAIIARWTTARSAPGATK